MMQTRKNDILKPNNHLRMNRISAASSIQYVGPNRGDQGHIFREETEIGSQSKRESMGAVEKRGVRKGLVEVNPS